MIVGVYVVFIDLMVDEYGEGSYNKGFYVLIFFDIMIVKLFMNRVIFNWELIICDGG